MAQMTKKQMADYLELLPKICPNEKQEKYRDD